MGTFVPAVLAGHATASVVVGGLVGVGHSVDGGGVMEMMGHFCLVLSSTYDSRITSKQYLNLHP